MRFLVPQGVGDALWALTKVQDANKKLGGGPIEVYVNTSNMADPEEARAIPFIERFDFVSKTGQKKCRINPPLKPGEEYPANAISKEGYFQYIPDGPCDIEGIDYALMPNAALERGIRLESWLPEFEINWDVADHFQCNLTELTTARAIRAEGPFCVFFMASLQANTIAGHNRNAIWQPIDWVHLGECIHEELGLNIVVVGAKVDLPYWEQAVQPLLTRQEIWYNFIGQYELPQVYVIEKLAKFVISYQSGVGIFASYLGIPLGIFWRAKGDSISSSFHVSFEEAMASDWAPPKMIECGKHLPLIYGRHGVDYIMDQIKEREW